MTTFRELEALVAVADMGSFDRAALRLETSQSAVSRLIKEFEGGFRRPLFDREGRSTRLTMEGQEVLALARAILRHRAGLASRLGSPELVIPTLRVGVTELAAYTWLPNFVAGLQERYPRVNLELDVASSPALHARLRDARLDVAVVLAATRTTDMARLPVGTSDVGWYAAPHVGLPTSLTQQEFEQQSLLIQGASTGAGAVMATWLAEHGLRPAKVIHSDSLMALLGMAAAGLGVASLPLALAREPVNRGALRQVTVDVGIASSEYVALVRLDAMSAFHRAIVELIRERCDFDSTYQRVGEAT
jgi:DNA-binding transcriptional LysR family regulator